MHIRMPFPFFITVTPIVEADRDVNDQIIFAVNRPSIRSSSFLNLSATGRTLCAIGCPISDIHINLLHAPWGVWLYFQYVNGKFLKLVVITCTNALSMVRRGQSLEDHGYLCPSLVLQSSVEQPILIGNLSKQLAAFAAIHQCGRWLLWRYFCIDRNVIRLFHPLIDSSMQTQPSTTIALQ